MKKLCLLVIASVSFTGTFAQGISKITISGNGSLEAISFVFDQNVKVYITREGNISKWGYDRFEARGQENYPDVLDAYVGRVDYYGQDVDAAFRGKIRSIGSTQLTYYASYENEAFQGKLKSLGSNNFEYYQSFEDEAYKGSLKSIGSMEITWYSSFDNAALKGKLKSIGNTQLSYYSSFDDKAFRGKLKSIDSYQYTYYSSFEKFSGSVKSGNSTQFVNSIRFYLRNY